MTKRRLSAALLIGALAAPALVACNASMAGEGKSSGTFAPSQTQVSQAGTPTRHSQTPTAATSPSGQAGAPDPESAVKEYVAMQDYLSQNPNVPLQLLAETARGEALKDAQIMISLLRGREQVLEGATNVTVETSSYDSDNRYIVKACRDSTGASLKDKKGNAIGAPDRATKFSYSYQVLRASDLRYYVVVEKMVKPSC